MACLDGVQAFEDDEADAGHRESEAFALLMQEAAITDVRSFTKASSRAAVAQSAAGAAATHSRGWLSPDIGHS